MEKLDWKRWLGSAPDQPFRPERFYQWRHFWDFGGGCVTDLMTHWIDMESRDPAGHDRPAVTRCRRHNRRPRRRCQA